MSTKNYLVLFDEDELINRAWIAYTKRCRYYGSLPMYYSRDYCDVRDNLITLRNNSEILARYRIVDRMNGGFRIRLEWQEWSEEENEEY